MTQEVSKCGEEARQDIRKLIWSVAEAAGTQLEGRVAERPDRKGVPEQIDGSRKDDKKKLPWQIPSTSAALAARVGGLHSFELAATSRVWVCRGELRRNQCS